ncbi:hypothetical protein CsSME_00051574 [Camellia sinensis var. sinensis]
MPARRSWAIGFLPFYDFIVEAAKGFLGVLRSYLDSLCSNLRSHTITNVQSNDDKLGFLKEWTE